MEPRFADLHCHPHMRSFNWLHEPGDPEKNGKYHPWWIIFPKSKASGKGKRAAAYSQCDLVQVTNGNMKLAFASLYPLEKGWVTGRSEIVKGRIVDLRKLIGNNFINDALSETLSFIMKPFVSRLGEDNGKKLAMRDFAQAIFMKLPIKKINFYQSNEYDYFTELKAERNYLRKCNNKETSSEIYLSWPKRWFVNLKRQKRKHPGILDATGTYEIAKNGKEVTRIIDEDKTALVLTIEGANVFNSHESLDKVLEKIKEVKDWEEPVFFITFTHHFYNFLAGQAHSLPDIGNLLLDQSRGLKEGFTDEGRKVIRYLLSLDDNNNYIPDELGKRILIDVKHMNAVSRKEFYDEIILPCLEKGDKIPVLASHVAYSGRNTLQEHIDHMDEEEDGYMAQKNGHAYNAWNINICDEDVLVVFKTGGLIGINFDQRVLGLAKEDFDNEERHAFYIWQNMKACMMTVIDSTDAGLPPKEKVVNMMCIGTDFDGYIDPVNKYATVLDLRQFRGDLIKEIDNDKDKEKLLFGNSSGELADKICFGNAYDFVVEHFG